MSIAMAFYHIQGVRVAVAGTLHVGQQMHELVQQSRQTYPAEEAERRVPENHAPERMNANTAYPGETIVETLSTATLVVTQL